MPRRLVVRELRISARTAAKILTEHGIHADEVRALVEGVGGLSFSWHYHSERGWRAILEVEINDRSCLVVLYPAEGAGSEAWNLGSAYPVEDEE